MNEFFQFGPAGDEMRESELGDDPARRTLSAKPDDAGEPAGSSSGNQRSDEPYLDFREEWSASMPPSPLSAVEVQSPESLSVEPRHPEQDSGSLAGGTAPPVGVDPARRPFGGVIPSTARGIARSVELRHDEQRNSTTLRFHLDRYDGSGNRLPPIGIEMRFHRRGQLTDGDEVEVTGSPNNGTLVAERIINLTTGAEILGGIPKWVKLAAVGFLAILVIAVIVAATLVRFNLGANGSPPANVSTPAVMVPVPDVTGDDLAVATQKLEAVGLSELVDFTPSSSVPRGQVIRSDPPAGTSVPTSARVLLFVSTGASS